MHAFEVEGVYELRDGTGDTCIDVSVLPNRSADCLSHRGLARELATLLAWPLKRDPLTLEPPTWDVSAGVRVDVAAPEACARYSAVVLKGITVGPSPRWLKARLEALGQRSINNIVDATNYVMFDVGQPLHAFDFNQLTKDADGTVSITVRTAREGEQLTTLDETSVSLTDDMLLIVDGVHDTPIGVAGVKGGNNSGVCAKTTDILIEAANFDPTAVRKTATRLNLYTDAAKRFQHQVSPELTLHALREVVALITRCLAEVGNTVQPRVEGPQVAGMLDFYPHPIVHPPVSVATSAVNRLLGTTLTDDEIDALLDRCVFTYERAGETVTVTPPFERRDLTIPEDLIEEIGRIYGYHHITPRVPDTTHTTAVPQKELLHITRLRNTLIKEGFSEVYTYAFGETGQVLLENPLARDKAYLRADLATGVRQSLKLNTYYAPFLGLTTIRVFEVGTVMTHQGERVHLCIGAHETPAQKGKNAKRRTVDDLVMTAQAHVGELFRTPLKGQLKDGIYEADITEIIQSVETAGAQYPFPIEPEMAYTPLSPYPFVLRDIALFVLPGTLASEPLRVITEHGGEWFKRADLFDVYEKDDATSYAFHLVFQASDRTLTDDEVNTVMADITSGLEAYTDWKVR